MSLTISTALSAANAAAANAPATAAAAPQPVQQAAPQTSSPAVTVTLTAAQQVFNLYNEGQTVPEIATSLNLPVGIVNNYLGITAGGG